MDPKGIVLSETARHKDKYCIISLIGGIQKPKQINKAKWKQTLRYREQTGGCQREEAEGFDKIGEKN